jgi:hypothetical protein
LGSASKNARPILEKTNQTLFWCYCRCNDVTNAKPDPSILDCS